MGRSVEPYPIVVLVVLALGGMLGGIVGLLVAVPAAAVARSASLQLRSARYADGIAAHGRSDDGDLLQST